MSKTDLSTSASEEQSSGPKEGHFTFFAKKQSPVPEPIEDQKKIGKKGQYYAWGKDNLYPQWLNELFQQSAIHSGIIRAKVHFTVAGGLEYVPADENDLEDLARWEQMFSNMLSDYDLNEVTEQLSLDFEISNRFIAKGRWSMDFSRVEKIEILDFEKCRDDVKTSDIYYSPDWSDKTIKYKRYELINLKLKGSRPKEGVKRSRDFYIMFQERSKQSKYGKTGKKLNDGIYASPPYSGGLKSICTGLEIDEYQNAEIVNGFTLGTIINLNNGEPINDQDKKDLEKDLKAATTGATNAGGVMVLYNNGKEREASVVNLNGNDLNRRYIELNKDTQKNILRAHSVTAPILFGFKEEGSLGNATELQIGYSIMKANYFKSRQDSLLSVLNFIGKKCNGLKGEIVFNEVSLDLPEDQNAFGNKVVINNAEPKEDKFEDEKKEERLMKQLEVHGSARGKRIVMMRKEITDPEAINEKDIIDEFKKQRFQLTDNQMQALNLIGEGNNFDNVKKALDLNSSSVARIYQRLIEDGFITDTGDLTTDGATELAQADIAKLEILYSYEQRLDAPALVPGGNSRDFCLTLLRLDRLYTRDQITSISAVEGYDVFSFKGGWYHNPNTDNNTPFCRHTWVQNVVFK